VNRLRNLFVCLLVSTLLGCAGAGQKTGVYVDDSTITSKVKSSLFSDPVTSGWNISVSTENGEVTLTGIVKSNREKERAAVVTRTVSGVKSVKNYLVVQ